MKKAEDAALEIGWNRSPMYFAEGKNPMSFTVDELAAIIRTARNEVFEGIASDAERCGYIGFAKTIRSMKEE